MVPLLKHSVPEMDRILWVPEHSEAMRSCPFSNSTDTVFTVGEHGKVGAKRGSGTREGERGTELSQPTPL